MMPREIFQTGQFRRDLKREGKNERRQALAKELALVLKLLCTDAQLPPKYRDHALIGEWRDCRDCHVLPDVVLIYRKPKAGELHLLRIGSHSTLEL